MSVSVPTSTLEKFTTFGDLLRFLRRRVGITQSELAAIVGYSDGQISRLEQNLRLPDPSTISSRFVPALGLEDEPRVVTRLLDLAENVRREDAPGLGLCPYKGLNYFDEGDADLFVGREVLTEKLTSHVLSLASGRTPGTQRFLAIVGASGSGKSSLVRAGLVPALHWDKTSADWPIHIFTPTAHPLENLAATLSDGNSQEADRLRQDLARDERSLPLFISNKTRAAEAYRWVLIVDQFEELFALCRSEAERIPFIDNLLTAASESGGPAVVIITLRADFYAHCANYPDLRQAVARQQEYIGAMMDEELRRVIEEPARRGRWELEPGLVELLLHDVGHEPGALPLLSHALLESWQRRRGRTMTLSGYASSGGVRGAIAETAEAVFTDKFTRQQQQIARRIFLRLTEMGGESPSSDTRRRATFDELILRPEDADTTQTVLRALADARLITTSNDSAEVAHEALIREWPTLRGWLEENREALRLHRQLTEAAQEWLAAGRPTDLLYRAGRLSQALEWRNAYPDEMNTLELEFLEASELWLEHETAEREAMRQRQLEGAQKLAEAEGRRAEEQARAARQLRKRALYLAAALAVALIMGGTAMFFAAQSRRAVRTEQAQQRIAFSRELAAASTSNLDVDPERSLLLSMQAVSVTSSQDGTWTREAEQAIHRALIASRLQLTLRGHSASVSAVAFSPDGSRIATVSDDGTLRVWDAETGQELIKIVTNATRGRPDLAFSPDGLRLAAPLSESTAGIWDAATGRQLTVLRGHTDSLGGLAFSPDGTKVATSSEDRTARVWDATTGRELSVLRGHSAAVWDVAFSPNGNTIATAGEDGRLIFWEAASGTLLSTIRAHAAPINGIAFSPDGTRIVTGSGDRTARVWDTATGVELLALRGHTGIVARVAFSPDGKRIATASLDGTARIWDALGGQEMLELAGHAAWVVDVAFSPECGEQAQALAETCGPRLATAGVDGTARIWDVSFSRDLLTLSTPDALARAFSVDGKRLAAGYPDGAVKVWDISKPLARAFTGGHAEPGEGANLLSASGDGIPVHAVALTPTGTLLAAGSEDGTIRVWDLEKGTDPFILYGHTASVEALAFSPDGTHLATAGIDYTAGIWDLSQAQGATRPARSLSLPNWSYALAFSPDGRRLATGTNDGVARVWDTQTGREVLSLRGHSGPIWGISFTRDGTKLATAGNDNTAILWDALTGKELLRLHGLTSEVNAIAFSPEDKRLATGSQDGSVKLWDATSGRELLSFYGNTSAVVGVAISSDGTRLATTSDDGMARFYLLRMEDLLALAERRVTRTFTMAECQQYLHLSEESCAQSLGIQAQSLPDKPVTEARQPTARGRICLVTDETGVHDQFYNELAYKGVKDAEQALRWQTAVLESRQPSDYQNQLETSVDLDCDLIVTPRSFEFSELTRTAAESAPDQKFLIMEARYEQPLENLRVEEYAVDQAAFLAGYAAASVTRSGKVGTFGGVNVPPVTIFMDGFARGIEHYNREKHASVELLGWDVEKREGLFVGNFSNVEASYGLGKQLLEEGADIILPVAGPAGLGTATAAREHGNAYLVGVDLDWAITFPEFSDLVLTSIQKRIDVSVLEAAKAIQDGSFTGGTHLGTLENGGVGIAPFHNLETLISPETMNELEQITADIIAGRIKTRAGDNE